VIQASRHQDIGGKTPSKRHDTDVIVLDALVPGCLLLKSPAVPVKP
jgi:hypothetical protein